MHNFISVGTAVPRLHLADPHRNEKELLSIILQAHAQNIGILLTPELSLTGVTCGDLFFQPSLIQNAKKSLGTLLYLTQDIDMLIFVGLPLNNLGNLYNVMVAMYKGKIMGIVPKDPDPSQSRWFAPSTTGTIHLFDDDHLFSPEIIFSVNGTRLQISPKTNRIQCAMLFNPWAEKEDITMNHLNIDYGYTSHVNVAYVRASPGLFESTTDAVYAGNHYILENDRILAVGKTYQQNSTFISSQIDTDLITAYASPINSWVVDIELQPFNPLQMTREISKLPFIPASDSQLKQALEIQAMGLARRLLHTQAKTAVIAVSGGLDSTLALLATAFAFDYLGKDKADILAITMPGFGTTDHTYQSAKDLITAIGTTFREISIVPAVTQHLTDIGHDLTTHDITYENAQARERTQILMDLANLENGIVIGTGGMSEIALGWATYNGDHMSMYNVNSGIPKTLIRHILAYVATSNPALTHVLHRILDTPVSPELLPPVNGEIAQKTEEILGSYELTDFFLYYMLHNVSPTKILFLATQAFKDYGHGQLRQYLMSFYARFFNAQYKRSCSVDGPQILNKSLSPRGGYVMPSDALVSAWLKEL